MATETERLLSTNEVMERLGVSKSTLWKLVKREDFPQPIKLSAQMYRWPESAITAWIEAQVSARQAT